jgi:hypothetical protein
MATVLDLFKANKSTLYSSLPSQVPTSKNGNPITPKIIGSKNPEIIIESQGLLNPARTAAVLAAQPTPWGDIITNNVAGLLTGITAKRPSDTIFFSRKFGPPITVNPLVSKGLATGVLGMPMEGTPYFVKTSTIPMVNLGDLLSGNPGKAANSAIRSAEAILLYKRGSNYGKGKGTVQDTNAPLTPDPDNPQKIDAVRDHYKAAVKRGHGLQFYGRTPGGEANGNLYTGRKETGKTADAKTSKTNLFYDTIISTIEDNGDTLVEDANNVGQTYIKIGVVSGLASNGITTAYTLVFPAAITGISEDVTPEWNSFRYLGSPFKVHRYSGVERSIKFNLKLYYTSAGQKLSMIKQLNSLKELAFPYPKLSEVKYGNDSQTTQYAFTPNLIKLSITGFYEGVLGFVDSLSFNIDDNTPWAGDGTKEDKPYPTVIDVALSMKVIEDHTIDGDNKFKYDFDKLSGKNVTKVTASPNISLGPLSTVADTVNNILEVKIPTKYENTIGYDKVK